MAQHTDFGDIIAADFEERKKGEEFVIAASIGGKPVVIKVLEAGPDSIRGQVKNLSNNEFSVEVETFNPDLIERYRRVELP